MCKQITGYFLRLSAGRTPEGKKHFARQSSGLRAVYTSEEGKAALMAQIEEGNLTARLQPAYGPMPSSQAQTSINMECGATVFDNNGNRYTCPLPARHTGYCVSMVGNRCVTAQVQPTDVLAARFDADEALAKREGAYDEEYKKALLTPAGQLTAEQQQLLDSAG